MKKSITIDVEEFKNRLDFILDKVDEVYYREVSKLVEEMKKDLENK